MQYKSDTIEARQVQVVPDSPRSMERDDFENVYY